VAAQSQPPAGDGPSTGSSAPAEKRDTPWTMIIIGVVALYALIVALLNSERVKVDFLFFSANVRLLVLIFLCLGLGFVVGFLFDRWRAGRKHRELA
jgi:uncharacterized integral membrane protein